MQDGKVEKKEAPGSLSVLPSVLPGGSPPTKCVPHHPPTCIIGVPPISAPPHLGCIACAPGGAEGPPMAVTYLPTRGSCPGRPCTLRDLAPQHLRPPKPLPPPQAPPPTRCTPFFFLCGHHLQLLLQPLLRSLSDLSLPPKPLSFLGGPLTSGPQPQRWSCLPAP